MNMMNFIKKNKNETVITDINSSELQKAINR